MSRALAAALVALVCWLSLTPRPPDIAGLPSNSDLAAHLLMHHAVGASLMTAWPGGGRVVLAWTLAIGLELAQLGVPGRTFSLWDMTANLIGASWGTAAAAAWLATSQAGSRSSRGRGETPAAADA
jgi:hypothetical protein